MNILTEKQSKAIEQLKQSETPNILKTNFGTIFELFQDGELFGFLLSVSLDRLSQFDNKLFHLDTGSKRVRYRFYSDIEKMTFKAYRELKKANYNARLQGSYLWIDTNGKICNELKHIGLSRCNKSDSPNYGEYYFSQFGKRLYNTGLTRQTIVRRIHRVA